MPKMEGVLARREAITKEMLSIRSMRRGTINEQYLKVGRVGEREPALRGPYYVFSRRMGDKTVSERLRVGEELEKARHDIGAHKRFVALCKEFEELTEQLMEMERGAVGAVEKKRRKSSSSKIRK
jgi:hypothetical protein